MWSSGHPAETGLNRSKQTCDSSWSSDQPTAKLASRGQCLQSRRALHVVGAAGQGSEGRSTALPTTGVRRTICVSVGFSLTFYEFSLPASPSAATVQFHHQLAAVDHLRSACAGATARARGRAGCGDNPARANSLVVAVLVTNRLSAEGGAATQPARVTPSYNQQQGTFQAERGSGASSGIMTTAFIPLWGLGTDSAAFGSVVQIPSATNKYS